MEIDTGSARTIVSRDTFDRLLGGQKLESTTTVLRTYAGGTLPLLGTCQVEVGYGDSKHQLELLVANVSGQRPILVRNWLAQIHLDWKTVFHIDRLKLEDVLEKHKGVFHDGLGTMKNLRARLQLKTGATPKFMKARPVPYALRPKVEEQLDNLEKEGVIVKTKTSDWATPIVVVPKKNGIRICSDYKVTLNPQLQVDKYSLPRPVDLFATLSGGHFFSTLDLCNAYHQMEVEEPSQALLTINTHKGLYRYLRLPFGVASAPSLFQKNMEQILQGIEGVVVYLDDPQVTGTTTKEHLQRLDRVLQRLEEFGLRLQRSKCKFAQQKVEYLGHAVDKEGHSRTK